MKMKVPYGLADFKTMRENGYLYVDKTMYIKELENFTKVIYTRPRRFGKSTFTNMIGYYYDMAEKDNFEKLFKGLYIYENPTSKRNSYYIMYFNFSGIKAEKELNKQETENAFNEKVIAGCRDFIKKYDLNIKFDEKKNAARILTEVISKFRGLKKQNQIYIMIDEYDHFTNGMLKGDAKDFLDILGDSGFVRNFYEVIKENCETMNPPVGEFFATGVSPITLDSLTSGFNIATKVTTKSNFTAMCGLTEDEVKNAINQAGITGDLAIQTYNKMKENYDGYIMNEEDNKGIFNTTLVMYYLNELQQYGRPPKELVDDNLSATGTKIMNLAGLMNREQNYELLKELLMNGEVLGRLTTSFELEKTFSRDDFLSMLFYNGYITIKEAGLRTKFKIPNYVTKVLYANYFMQITEIKDKYKADTNAIEDAMYELGENGKFEPITKCVQDFLFHTSVRDKENFYERDLKFIYEFMLNFTEQYAVYAEYPAGQGFADLFIQKATNSLAKYDAIVELKYLSKQDAKVANMQKLEEDAKNQIEKYMKDKRLQQKETLKKYMVIFKGFEEYFVKEI